LSVHVRLLRMGAKKRPFYRIVAVDSRRARDGSYLENLGTYNPITTPAEVIVREQQLSQWLDRGAEPSETVRSLLTQIGYMEKRERAKRGEDVSEVALRTTINERKKTTRKMKKASLAAEAATTAPEAASPETPSEAPAAEEKQGEETETKESTE
jgi:small subunit ribosomal protein S16